MNLRRRLLLADDDGALRDLLREALEQAGFVVAVAASGPAALEAFREAGPFDVLLLDEDMPGLSGREVLSAIRAFGGTTPAVMMSGTLQQLADEEQRRLGVVAVLGKPTPLDALTGAVLRACRP